MENWTKEQIERGVRRRGILARLRFSTANGLARIDLYCRAGLFIIIENALAERGWQRAGALQDMPEGVAGYVFRHSDASAEHHQLTRAVLLEWLDEAPAPKRGPTDGLRLAPAEVPTDYEGFHAWAHFACVEWHEPLLPMSFHAGEGLRRGDDTAFRKFMEAYDKWWDLPEDGKFKQMHPVQRTSARRVEYLQKALAAAHSHQQ